MVMFMLYSVISSFVGGTATFNVLRFTAQFIMTNILAVSAIVLVSYTVAILTYRRGWDSDNFVIPIESSLADSITTISLLIALNTIG